jgi:cell division protein ZapA
MAEVTVTVDGKAYRMACEEGQEEHLTELAVKFDRYVGHLKGQFGEIGDLRLTVMAGIMVMDELSEVQRQLRGVESEVGSLKKTRDTALASIENTDADLAKTIGQVTEKLERIAGKLEQS